MPLADGDLAENRSGSTKTGPRISKIDPGAHLGIYVFLGGPSLKDSRPPGRSPSSSVGTPELYTTTVGAVAVLIAFLGA